MTQEEIIELWKKANGWDVKDYQNTLDDLMRFAKLVAEKEREACAVIAEEWFCGCGRGSCPEGDRRAHDIADSIRERGQA